jgi:hypothetical protein
MLRSLALDRADNTRVEQLAHLVEVTKESLRAATLLSDAIAVKLLKRRMGT